MKEPWKIAATGGLGGAVLAIVAIYAVAALGLLPVRNDAAIHDYMMAHPDLVIAMENKAQEDADEASERASQQAVDKLGMKAFFDPRVAFISGPADAKKTIVEFFDYNCPYCRASVPAVQKFYLKHKNDTRFAFIEFPFKGAASTFASRVALAARKQGDKYMALHFALMNEQDAVNESIVIADAQKAGLDMNKLANDMKAADNVRDLSASLALADAAKVSGTPFFIVNGHVRSGALDDAILNQMAKS